MDASDRAARVGADGSEGGVRLTARQLVSNQRNTWVLWDADGPILGPISAQWRAREFYQDEANEKRRLWYEHVRPRAVIIGKSCVVVS